ncbi:MAG: cysteine--tRNA ligase [Actinomycetota bacterium]|nr:cysteine--tRNA ligase [Actinomycetota bacterium]
MLRLAGGPLPVVGPVRMYVCGITPYDVTHLGHAATFVWADLLGRVLRHLGSDVVLCRNVTDVDDVLTAAAQRAGTYYDRFAAVQQYQFDQDMAALGVRRPDVEPRAHAHVDGVIALAAALLAVGAAYEEAGSVFLIGADVPGRAGLSSSAALALAEEYGDAPGDPAKRDALDVSVWQRSTGDEPAWDSPWGPGRPGWHAECAAMALAVFGSSLDVHAGGRDLAFPHHAYEAAMAEAVTGVTPFARRWMHVGTVGIGGAKMAKSTGNLVLVGDLLERSSAAALRLLLVDRDWSADWEYDPAALATAEGRLERLQVAAGRPGGDQAVGELSAALADDLDVPRALAVAEESGGAAARTALSVLGLL